MIVRSTGYRTDLIFPTFDGRIVDRGDHLVVQTPSNPSFYWGNFLIFKDPPSQGDHLRWRRLFADEIGHPLRTTHETLGWDSPEGTIGWVRPFLEAGFALLRNTVLAAAGLRPPPHTSRVEVRPVESEADWEQALDLQVLCRDAGHAEAGYRLYRQRQIRRYRAMIAAGWGRWYGAFLDGRLAGDLGIFHHEGLGRFQSVETHPDLRRRGIAGTLVYEAAYRTLAESGITSLILVAEAESPAERLYRSVGFDPLELQVGLERWQEA